MAQESATVLPKGIWRARAVSVFSLPVKDSFNNDGAKVELLNKMNASIPAKTQAAQNPQLMNLYTKLNQVESGLGDKLFQTELFANGTLNFQRYTTALEYGVTDRFSLGVIVPVVRLKLEGVRATIVHSQADDITKKLEASGSGMYQPLIDGVEQFSTSIPTAAYYEKALFTDKGYNIQGINYLALGDIEVGGVYNFLKSTSFKSSFKSGFRLPTANHVAIYSNPLDKSSGDKQLDFAVQNILNYDVTSNTTLATSLKYTWQLKDKRYQPVPVFGQVGLTDLNGDTNWDQVTRDLGDMFDAELSLTQYFQERSIFAYSFYAYTLKEKDTFKGSKSLDFASLSLETEQVSHKYEIGLGYSTIPAFRAKRFAVPLEFKVAFNGSLSGKNTPDAAYTRFDAIVYF